LNSSFLEKEKMTRFSKKKWDKKSLQKNTK
jgi:hypothetical protein